MLARRLLIVLAVLLGLTALAAGVAPRESAVRDGGSTPSVQSSQPAPDPVQETLDASAAGQRVVARPGQMVTIVVESDELDTVLLAEVGAETTEPDHAARFELLAEIPGTYKIDLLEAERTIGTLEIRE